ncbi:DUF4260 domain-containing protein [Belliella kenyensis]|uniref:DUF4260 domain-containing protein n=1 Tax=Belliella kenyensis TaxID=1472724 RepID=A0ABV8EIF7_9BACT|nr:DUF4260 domain-containing protein [Belliella kenyensis]MCH7401230.1 DUF4260 domain-containing protein [Belliella kenyensis]MDN3602676.1 DUF4260 domain-containing protein [Belliella kenyensis]
MIKLIKLEEIAQLILSIIIFNQLDFAWWVFLAFILLPDLSMLGYLFNTKIGAITYNIFHHKLLGIMLFGLGIWMDHSYVMLAGVILFGHAAMDRIFGYGLKYADDFKHTHLGWIGKK